MEAILLLLELAGIVLLVRGIVKAEATNDSETNLGFFAFKDIKQGRSDELPKRH
jgi:hypothetical protein